MAEDKTHVEASKCGGFGSCCYRADFSTKEVLLKILLHVWVWL